MTWRVGKRNKLGNVKTQSYGRSFDSKLEKALFEFLSAREASGELSDLHHHPGTVFLSEARIQYRPDYSYTRCATNEKEWAESKGFESSDWRIKRKLWLSYGPGKLWIYAGSYKKLFLKEMLEPEKK